MEISSIKLKNALILLKNKLKCEDKSLNGFLRLKKITENDVDKIYKYLNEKLLDFEYTEYIGLCFSDTILLIVSSVIKLSDNISDNFDLHQRKCIVLSKLIKYSPDILKYSTKYFAKHPAPFKVIGSNVNPKKKTKLNEIPFTELEIIKCCYNLLSSNPVFYKDIWNWSEFLELYLKKGSPLQQLYCNHINGILTNMTEFQIKQLNNDIPEDVKIKFDHEINKNIELSEISSDNNIVDENVIWNFNSDVVINVEGVLLSIYNNENCKFYEKTDGNYDKIVNVESTQINLRSISLGIASNKPICLSGPVGCGKTTLVEYLARKTGRICPKTIEVDRFHEIVEKYPLKDIKNNKKVLKENGTKRKSEYPIPLDKIDCSNLTGLNVDSGNQKNGFLRIQLGDQTDSKMLLGQYRCTDVPGEFIWLPGVLTQAVMNGYWLLLEDLDSATQDTFTILSNLMENNSLNVPGFRDCVKIEPGFQLFVTTRTNKTGHNSQKSLISLLEKYLYTINILPLSRHELCHIISVNYPKLKTIANRIVDVYLTFSSGDHNVENLRSFPNENSIKANSDNENYIALPFEKISISNLTNYGRLVSTRDLMKLCQRSNPMFSVTSTECAYFVFQNAVDVFCSYLPAGPEKTKLITSIGAKIGIIQSRCEFFANEYKPEILIDNERIKIGRSELKPKSELDLKRQVEDDDFSYGSKKVKLNENSEKIVYLPQRKNDSMVTFSFTRMASCLLERITVCVAQNEPILLVGETGVGKTSSVQYLAQKTNHKLIVINMNNQSDVSDLIGGFKPIDLSYVMAPLRSEFEQLFRKTFNEYKNEKFLNNISICYNQGNFHILIKLMIKITDTVFERANNNTLTIKNPQEYLKRWCQLQTKILKLNSQLQKSINISFAFIPGSLVNCIKNGNWVLLDEINLASAETLECLSTILEPDGSVVLLEKGDFVPVKRHPNFRILACMNPNTDIGKKDLPVGIRNRFTEFFVDELTTENDLILLVNDYLSNTGIKKTKVLNIVKLYKKLKLLSNLELNDGLGNRPVFSLRTLCRSLMICAKNLCGSIERNLYESFCLSFLTQLDPISHKIVSDLIKEAMLSNAKAILSQGIPQPGENFINFEGYWIERGAKEINECENYILTDSVKQNLKDLSRIISIGKLPILLQGPTSAGKTSLIEYVAKKSGNHCLRINNHEHTDLQEYIGTYTSDVSGKLTFKEGVLVQAMRNGFWIILDELNLASTDILEALNRVLDDNRELFIPETQTVIKAHPNFMLFATQNPPGLYGGRKTLSRAFKNRFIELHFSEIPKPELEIILEKRCLIPKSYSQKMVKCMSELQANRKTTTKNNFTLRDLFRWGNRYTYADKKLLSDNSYDWNQHLVDEGYLVLSAKVRTDIEVEIIEEALYKNFRKKINTENLYSLTGNVSMVTKEILESIYNYKNRNDIIWTLNMTRMAILTAKALQFNEPVLLVGPTGCGKTTICQILANIKGRTLRILNCHMHTEGADFLGGLRPCRTTEENVVNNKNVTNKKQLFEWADGPLVMSMQEGSFFMADEISLAEDSVLERLNSILEPERTVLLAEKGGVSSNVNAATLTKISKDFIIQAHNDFNFFATMNPGGDFGKKELSPALRNRFTEIWCKPSDNKEDLIAIAENCLNSSKDSANNNKNRLIANVIINIVFYLKEKIEKFKFSVRDILSWSNYIQQNSNNCNLDLPERIVFGLETIFLDSLEMLPHESSENIIKLRNHVIKFAILQMKNLLKVSAEEKELQNKRGNRVEYVNNLFGIKPFYIETNNKIKICQNKNFLFDAPTTKNNLFRLLSALSLKKAILLEGPPGVGKTSIVESLAKAIGYKIVRINLCEHTDLADLFGTDLPAEEKSLELNIDENVSELNGQNESTNLGSFVWRDGPLLAALKSENTWILLDELNLAPQSVLEGLNAILDHRGEVFIPELNKVFSLGKQTRIFACQNPLRQGGGRKGLPQSFLNRFTKVYLRKLNTDDLLHVVNGRFFKFFEQIKAHYSQYFNYIDINNNTKSETVNLFDVFNTIDQFTIRSDKQNIDMIFNLAERMVSFSENLDKGITNLEFGYKGGPFEINLRDILRWCDLLINDKTGFVMNELNLQKHEILYNLKNDFNNFLLILYERMKLVYYHRMRSEQDHNFIRNSFSVIFNCDVEKLDKLSEDIGIYWTDSAIYLNDIVLERNSVKNIMKNDHYLRPLRNTNTSTPLLLHSQRELLKNLTECVHMEKPVILCGPSDSGKTKAINILCTISNQICNLDTIDDSVTGSFQQIDLNRHLEEVSQNVESILIATLHNLLLSDKNQISKSIQIFDSWYSYTNLIKIKSDNHNSTAMSDELILFKKRIEYLSNIIEMLLQINVNDLKTKNILEGLKNIVLKGLKNVIKNSDSLNTGGHFEWVDSKIVKSLKTGQYICLEHVNLCSSAILDRLNPVFETNGNLLISEKGVTADDEAEIVEKHQNFRAFLTLDPKNGELSRAMRNRCIELYLTKDAYTNDDLKMIIYMNGVHKMNLINIILRIHDEMKNVTDINNFNISHLTQFAFLVSSYKRIGYSDEKSIVVSGLEVYVYSSNSDLLGFGLAFYQNKLKDIIIENSKNSAELSIENYNLKNIIITCDNLDFMSLVKLQCEPLVILLNNLNDTEMAKKCIGNLFENLKYIKFENNFDFIKYYLYFLYETSTFEDVSFRHKHLSELLNSSTKLMPQEKKYLIEVLNNNLFNCIKYDKADLKNYAENLPWNTKLLPRIREYQRNLDRNSNAEFQLSALLLSCVLIEIIADEKVCKLSKISAIGYSQAINSKSIGDSANNILLQNLSTFLSSLKLILRLTIKESSYFDIKTYVELIIAYLWYNRLYNCSKTNELFIDKTLNSDFMDKLLLHFKWLDKKLLKILEKLLPNYQQLKSDYDLSLEKIRNYSLDISHPLNLIKKLYFKKIINFDPFYSEEQIRLNVLKNQFDDLINLVPHFGSFENNKILKKYLYLFSDSAEKFKSIILSGNIAVSELFKKIRKIDSNEVTELPNSIPENLKITIKDFEKNQLSNEFNEIQVNFNDLENLLNCNNVCEKDEIKKLPNFIEIEILSLREYFLSKYLSQTNCNSNCSPKLNTEYYENIPSLKCSDLELIHIVNSEEFKNFDKMWTTFMNSLVNLENLNQFEKLIKCFTSSDYRNFTTFFRTIINYNQIHQLSSLSYRRECCLELQFRQDDINSEQQYNGPSLTNIILSMLFKSNGHLRSIPLSDLNLWKNSLNNIRQLLWSNSNLMSMPFSLINVNLKVALLYSQKLIFEIEYIQNLCQNTEKQNFSDYNKNFEKLVNKLKIIRKESVNNLNNNLRNDQIHSALLHTVIGSIELCLLTFTPLIDPVDKNRLKNKYITEDINCLTTLTNVYDFMKIIMKYNNFGSEIYSEIEAKISCLEKKKEKYLQKVALRTENCIYGNLVQDINHFLNTNCKPQSLLSLIIKIEELLTENVKSNAVPSYLLKISECLKIIEVWIVNSQRFVHHTLKKYCNFYRDFIQPIECSITMTRFGLEELKASLTQLGNSFLKHENGFYENLNENDNLINFLENIVQFPSTNHLKVFESGKVKKLFKKKSSFWNKIDDSERLYFTLLKGKILELKNRTIISLEIDLNIFDELEKILHIVNKIWQEEEERRRKRIAEEESLYVNKTRCKEENEEEIELLEIQENFPTNVEQDFGEFVVEETLEKIIKLPNLNNKKVINLIDNEDFKLLGETFIFIIEHFSRNYYYQSDPAKLQSNILDFVAPYKERVQVFVNIFNQYKPLMNELIDDRIYNSFGFAVGLQQDLLNEISLNNNTGKVYNFYKDSNIPEIISCSEILNEIDIRVQEQINLYPEHATLNDIIRVIVKIRSLPTISSVVRFNTGFQILRQKLSLWNEVAHKNNHMRDLETRVAEYVQQWTKLELQFWRNCLSQTNEKVESNAYKYWFFIYNLLHEYLDANEVDSTLSDFRNTEKRFEEGNFDNENEEKTFEIHSIDVIRVLRQFIESSNYGDFQIRMKLLKTFELYLNYIPHANEIRKDILIAILHNLQIYYDQFSEEIDETKKSVRTPIEKKLREFVKIESYNKDLSYFSMRNNVARVHRTLNKFLKEYEIQLKNKITPVFQQKNDNLSKELNLDNEKGGKNLRHETKMKYYMIDVKNFLALPKMINQFKLKTDQNMNTESLILLNKLDKLFITSRNVCKEIILHTDYSNMIYSLDSLLTDQIETCEYLKKLEVDRTQERPKQIIQAKNILQQKRKSLSDLFKTLSTLGMNYKTGLMELSLNTDFADYKIQPFCIKNMFSTVKYKKLDQNLIYLSENLDKYFAKCIFKLNLLKNAMLTPQSELGLPNIDRIKGFSIDMFLLIQNQRKLLSKSMKEIYDLRCIVEDITNLNDCAQTNDFSNDKLNFSLLEEQFIYLQKIFSKIQFVFEQFKILLKCIPDTENSAFTLLENKNLILIRNSDKYLKITEICDRILEISKKSSQELHQYKRIEFLNFIKISEFLQIKENIISEIYKLREMFAIKNNEHLPISKPLSDLLNFISDLKVKEPQIEENSNLINIENINVELENIVHSILLAMQKLYKKYSEKETNNDEDEKKLSPNKKPEIIEDQSILENHLKQKLYNELILDMDTFNIGNILQKLLNILYSIKYTYNLENKKNYICKIVGIAPILQQFSLIGDYYVFQQLGAHKVSTKMLSIMLTVFIELLSKGFCVPADLMQDEEGDTKKEEQKGEGFGLEDGTGEKDASDKIENEDQLDDAKKPEDRKKETDEKNENCKEEKGIEMSEDFDANLQDIEKPDNESDEDNDKSDEEDELDKQMGDTEQGAEKLDDQIWGSDEEKESESENEDEMSEEENGKGNKDEDDQHNKLDTNNEKHQKDDGDVEQQDGLDATNDQDSEKEKKKQEKDIDNMKEPDVDEDQLNPYHNELEEPPEPEDMDLGDNFNLEEENAKDNDNDNGDNPFDIDTMKENMEIQENHEENEDNNDDGNKDNNEDGIETDSESEPEAGTKRDEDESKENVDEEEENQTEIEQQTRGDIEPENSENIEEEEENPEAKVQEEKIEKYEESKDKPSNEENVQSIPEEKHQGSNDDVQNDEKDAKQEQDMDAQDTGEDKDGVGIAENDTADRGHQGIADTKETKANEERTENETKNKKKQGKTNEERTLGDPDKNKTKQLKTIDKLKEQQQIDENDVLNESDDKVPDAEEYQHVKEAKTTDSTTIDNATEEQSKQIQHLEDENKKNEEENENNDILMETDENIEENLEEIPDMKSEKNDQKSEKPSKSEKSIEKCETLEKMEVEGDLVDTMTVQRGDDTAAHTNKDILLDTSISEELTTAETLELRKLYQNELIKNKTKRPDHETYEFWHIISNKMQSNARELCEQLRLILEPTKCTRLKGDYRTGRRINMKKIIPYIASQFRKDKIWLRRTKPAQRDYKITIAIDDSKSMHHNNSKNLTLEAISLVSQALTLLESGKLSIVSFGESPQIILNHTEQFDGPKLVNSLNFDQNQSRIAELLDFIRTANTEEGCSSSDNGIFENLLLVLSDGRNIFSEGEQKVKNAIKLARLQRIFLVYIIIDNPENKHSILDIRVPNFSSDRKSISMKSYLDMFPFPYYVIVRDLDQLPIVLSEAMRQWFELVNSDQ